MDLTPRPDVRPLLVVGCCVALAAVVLLAAGLASALPGVVVAGAVALLVAAPDGRRPALLPLRVRRPRR